MKLWDLQNEEIRKLLRKLSKGKTVKTSKTDVEPANSVELRIILPKRTKKLNILNRVFESPTGFVASAVTPEMIEQEDRIGIDHGITC